MGTVTVTIRKRTAGTAVGTSRVVDIAMSTSYATGGDTVPLSALELKEIEILNLGSTNGGYAMEVVYGAAKTDNPKIKLYEDKATAGASPFLEAAAGSNESGVTVRALAFGDAWAIV